jgi:hypothetical protein
MDPLSQRLKELPREDFEKLCCQLLKARHPNADVRHVEGAGGDFGVDTFIGDLADGPAVWQSKAFADGIGKSQKEQIRQSLRQAVRKVQPRLWILCISVDMDIHAHKWFQKLAASYANTVDIRLMQGSDIVSELLHRRSIQDYFFPGATLDVNELRSLLTRTGDYSDTQMAALTEENALQIIERLKQRDARFNYEIVIAKDQTPSRAPSGTEPTFSIMTGSTSINAYPRDVEALRLDPPKVRFRFRDSGVSKIDDFVKTGRAHSFSADEIESVQTDLSFPEIQTRIQSLRIGPSAPKRSISTRVVFGIPAHNVTYGLVTFAFKRVGKEEVELISTSKLPFILNVVRREKDATFQIAECLAGSRFMAAKKYFDALTVLNETRELEIYDLEDDRCLFRAKVQGKKSIPVAEAGFVALINDGARIAQASLQTFWCRP